MRRRLFLINKIINDVLYVARTHPHQAEMCSIHKQGINLLVDVRSFYLSIALTGNAPYAVEALLIWIKFRLSSCLNHPHRKQCEDALSYVHAVYSFLDYRNMIVVYVYESKLFIKPVDIKCE